MGDFRGRGRGGSLEPCLLLAVLHLSLVVCTFHVPVAECTWWGVCVHVRVCLCMCMRALSSWRRWQEHRACGDAQWHVCLRSVCIQPCWLACAHGHSCQSLETLVPGASGPLLA